MVIIIELRVRERGCHVTYLLGLCHKVQSAMLDKLQDIGHPIRTMQIDITLLLTDETAIVLTAEPALTAAGMKNERVSGCAVNELLEKATGKDGFTQAGLFVRAKTLEEQPEAVKAYLELVKEAASRCTEDPDAVAEAAVALEILPSVKVAKSALPNCAIRYVSAAEAKEQIEQTAEIDLTQYGGAVPADDFYYGAE